MNDSHAQPTTPHDAAIAVPSLTDEIDQLDALARLEPDWDSYGAAPISPEAITQARALVERIAWSAARQGREAHPYYIGPTPTGGVQVEWRGNGRESQIEIRPDRSYGCLSIAWHENKRARTYLTNVSVQDVLAHILDTIAS